MKVIVKKQIRVQLPHNHFIEEDGNWYWELDPGEYELYEIEEYDVDGDRISMEVSFPMYFWTTDVDEKDYEVTG